MRKLIVGLAGVVGLSLSACGKSIDTAEWVEEVKLSNGTIVTVSRKVRAYSGGFPNSNRGRNIDFEFAYSPLNVRWVAAISPTFIRDPVSFDIIDGVPHLVLFVGDREYCRSRPKADYTAQYLRWVNGRWIDVPQAQFPIDKVLMNVSGDYWGGTPQDDYKGLIRWEEKRLRVGGSHTTPDTVKSYFERGRRDCESSLKN